MFGVKPEDIWKTQRKKHRNKKKINNIRQIIRPINTSNGRRQIDQIIRPNRRQGVTNVDFGTQSTRNKLKKVKEEEEERLVSLWMKTTVIGDLSPLMREVLTALSLKPCGGICTLWQCLHNEMQRLMEKNYPFTDFHDLRAQIYGVEKCNENDDASLAYLTAHYRFDFQLFSLNEDFKTIKFERRSVMMIKMLHIGLDNFIALMPNNGNGNYQIDGELEEVLLHINTTVRHVTGNNNLEKEKLLLITLREKLQGIERVQDMPEIPIKKGRKKAFYDVCTSEELQTNKNLKLCTLSMKNAHVAVATIIKRENEKEKDISLLSRKSCGYNAFEGDTVYVKINHEEINDKKSKDQELCTGKVLGVQHSYHQPINSIYVCNVSRDQGSHMIPLDKSFPKIHVDNEPGRRRYEMDLKRKTKTPVKDEQKSVDIRRRENTSYADNIYVSIFNVDVDKINKKVIFKELRTEKFDPETCDKLFLVCYQYWDISYMYPSGKVVGMISTYDSFKDSLHLILPLCKIEPTIINDVYKEEINIIKKKVKENVNVPHDIVPAGAMVFTIDNEETEDMDDALSYHVKYNMIVVGVHITDITKYISPQHEIYKQAQRRFATAYIPKKLGVDPVYLIEKGISTDALSLVQNQPRAVLSVMFHFTMTSPRVITNVTFHETVIKSKYKLNYQQVEEWIKEIKTPIDVEEDLFIAITQCHEIAKEIRRKRFKDSYFVRQSKKSDPSCNFDDSFNARFLIEEFIIMANENVAKKIYERYPNMSLIHVQDPVTDYNQWEERLFKHMNMKFPSSLRQYCNLLKITRTSDNDNELVTSLQYYNDFRRYLDEDLNRARNMLQYDEYINNIYVHMTEWYHISPSARYQCSVENSVDNRHFSLDKDIYTHFTSPIRRFTDVIVHRMLKSIINPSLSIDSIDENTIEEVCAIANQRLKNNKLFEKRCAPYAIFESSPSLYNFVLDCACTNITNEELHFVHPSLARSSSIKSIKFSYLSLNSSPIKLKANESAKYCVLKWRKIIYSHKPTYSDTPRCSFVIESDLYDARLPESAHKLFRELRHSYLPTKDLEDKLQELSRRFSLRRSDIVISSNFSAEPIIKISQKISIKNTLRIQFCSYKVNGLKRINPELLIVHPSLQLCLIHQEDPVMCFVPGGRLELEHNDIIWRFESITQYKNYFIQLIQLESLKEIMSEKSEFTLLDIPIGWLKANSSMTNKEEIFGIIKYNAELCESQNIRFSEESDDLETNFDNIINDGLLSATGDLLCLRGKKKSWNNYWVGHGAIVTVCKYQRNTTTPIIKVIMFMLTQSDFDIFRDDFRDMTFNVEVYHMSVSSKWQLLAVASIDKDRFLRNVILGDDIRDSKKDEEMLEHVRIELTKQATTKLNDMQNQALTNAMVKKLSLIWGPPGTGKTSIGCILSYCYCIKSTKLENKGVILYCGPSNECVNLVTDSMKEKFKNDCPRMLRIFAKQQELADFPLPGYFSDNKPLTGSLQEISLHYMVRKMDHPLAKELTEYDKTLQEIRQFPHLFNKEKHDGKSVYEIINDYKSLLNKAKVKLIENNNFNMVICTTSVSADPIIDHFNVTQVIIDEAGMCKEPETLIPILNTSSTIENVVLIGDHKQLRPIIKHDLARKRGLQISLFERYQFLKPEHVTMLNFQYRMHPSICEFPSRNFYSGLLQTKQSLKWSGLKESDLKDWRHYHTWNGVDYQLAKGYYKSCLKSTGYSAIPDNRWPGQRIERYVCFRPLFNKCPERVVFIHVVGDEISQSVSTATCGKKSRANITEVETVGYVYDKLIGRFDPPRHAPSHITVLTQYRLQEDYLFKECKEKLRKRRLGVDPIVKTVTKSQGSENDYIIFSTVRSLRNTKDIISNPTPGWEKIYLGSITDENQVNVALTRARKGLIIIGNKNLLSVNDMWKKLLSDLEDRRCVVYDCDKFL